MKKMPKKIYLMVIEDSSNDYLRAEVAPEDFDKDEDGKVGIYELKEVKTKSTKIELK